MYWILYNDVLWITEWNIQHQLLEMKRIVNIWAIPRFASRS